MAGITDYLASRLKSLTPEKWDGFVRWIDSRFRVLEEKADITDRVADSILARGLQVIEDGIGPAIIQAEQAASNVKAIADLGMIFTASSSSSVLIGTGTKAFTIPADKKNQFAPAEVLAIYGGEDYANAIIGVTQTYNRETGLLTVEVIETIGSGIFSSWTITPVATTRDLEALRDQVQADRLQAGLNAGAAVNAKNDAQSIATDFRSKHLGTKATDPVTDGNGNPVTTGALYTNSGSGKLRYYGLSGWQDTTAGTNIFRVEFVTDDRGTAPYPLPEAPASKDNCFVIAGGSTLKASAYTVAGTGFSFVADPGAGVAVEVKIIAQLAIGVPSDDTVDAAKLKTAAVNDIRTKLGISNPTTANVGAAIAGANGKTTPDDGDRFAGVLSGASTVFWTTWGNIKAALDVLYYRKAAVDTALAGKVAKTGDTLTGDITVNKNYPTHRMLYPGVRDVGLQVREDGSTWIWDFSGNRGIFRVGTDGALWNVQIGDLNTRIEDRAYAHADARAWAVANDRVANLNTRWVSRGEQAARRDLWWEVPAGSAMTGLWIQSSNNQIMHYCWRYFQLFDPVRGWITAHNA